jgi:hypothetical protein
MNIILLLNDCFDQERVRSRAAKFLRTDYVSHTGDWAYSHVARKRCDGVNLIATKSSPLRHSVKCCVWLSILVEHLPMCGWTYTR